MVEGGLDFGYRDRMDEELALNMEWVTVNL